MADISLKCEADITLMSPGIGMAQSYKMVGTCAAIFDMETMSGRGFFDLVSRLKEEKASMTDLTAIVTAGIKAGGQDQANPKAVAEMIFLTGIGIILPSVDIFLQRIILGGRDLGELLAGDDGPKGTPDSPSDDTSAFAAAASDGVSGSSGKAPPPPCGPLSSGGTSAKVVTTRKKPTSSRRGKKK